MRRLAVIVAMMAFALGAPAATAFERYRSCNYGSGVFAYNFLDSFSTEQASVQQGFEYWNSVRGLTGSQHVDVHNYAVNGAGVRIDIKQQELSGGAQGRASCTNYEIVIDPTIGTRRMNADEFRFVAAHEMGHILGLEHTGEMENLDVEPDALPPYGAHPVMKACGFSMYANGLTPDDIAGVHYHYSAMPKYFAANSGFEGQGTGYWRLAPQDGSTFAAPTGLAANTGNRYGLFDFANTSSNVYQRIDYLSGGGHQVDVAGAFSTDSLASAGGTVRVELLSRTNSYAGTTDSCQDTQFEYTSSNLNDKNTRFDPFVLRTSYTCTVTTTWTGCNAPVYVTPSTTSSDFQVRVFSNVKKASTGEFYRINIDDLRFRERT